jgi:hypothetical protein
VSTEDNGSGHLGNHWTWRPDWRVDRPHLMWYLVFGHEPALHAWLRTARGCLSGQERLDVIPQRWLHCTVDDVGFVDELAPEQVERVARAGEEAMSGLTVPALTLGPAAPMRDALVLRARPTAELCRLRDALRAATVSVLGSQALSPLETYEPHVSFAYANRPCRVAPLMDLLRSISDDELRLSSPAVALTSVTRLDRHYQWTVRSEVTARQPSASS